MILYSFLALHEKTVCDIKQIPWNTTGCLTTDCAIYMQWCAKGMQSHKNLNKHDNKTWEIFFVCKVNQKSKIVSKITIFFKMWKSKKNFSKFKNFFFFKSRRIMLKISDFKNFENFFFFWSHVFFFENRNKIAKNRLKKCFLKLFTFLIAHLHV